MSIESSTASSPKAANGIEGQASKNKAKPGAEEGNSFSSVLSSIDPEPTPVEAVDAKSPDEDKAKKADAPAVADAALPADALILPSDVAVLLEQSAKLAGEKQNLDSDALPTGVKTTRGLAGVALAADKPEVATTDATLLAADKSIDAKNTVKALLDQMGQSTSDHARKAWGAELQAEVAAKLSDARATKLTAALDNMGREPALTSALATSGMGESLLRPSDKPALKPSGLFAGAGVEGVWGQSNLQTGSRFEAPAVTADASKLSTESMVADKVSYWVTQGVQNAQLKLEGFGADPVQVNITLKGDQAYIGFRTDQPEIRQILEGAVAHLKDLLTSEGFVLSGVSVGTSGQNETGAGSQGQQNQSGARQASIVTIDSVPAVGRQPVSQSAGRTLDLFV